MSAYCRWICAAELYPCPRWNTLIESWQTKWKLRKMFSDSPEAESKPFQATPLKSWEVWIGLSVLTGIHIHTHIPTESSWLSYELIGGMSVKLSKSGLMPNCKFLLPVKWNLDPSYVFVKYFFLILKLDPISNSIKIKVSCATYFEYTRYALNLNFQGQHHWTLLVASRVNCIRSFEHHVSYDCTYFLLTKSLWKTR